MRPLGEFPAGEHGWHGPGGRTFGPLSVAARERPIHEPIAPVREETAQQVAVSAEPDAPTAAASALLRKAREADDARARRRMIDPWRERR